MRTNRARRGRPGVESLESRDLPSVFHPTFTLVGAAHGVAPLSSAGASGTSPAQVRHAYGFDQVAFRNGTVAGDGSGQTIAIVDAYDDPTIAADLLQFDAAFNLPDPTFTEVNQSGGSVLPASDPNWAVEIALDVEWAHAIAPKANILLVEANSSSSADLFPAVQYAAKQPGVVAVSMSWGGNESGSEPFFDSTFTTPGGHGGVTFVASAGDSGAPAIYPAASPNILSVGGTTLSLDAAGNVLGESAWSGGGGGPSAVESQPGYQKGVVTQTNSARATPDVAYDSDPKTGFPIIDTFTYGSAAPWVRVGGTSAAAPQWAALVAIADQGRALAGLGSLDGPTQTLPALYHLPAGDFRDITSGSSTGTPTESAGPGYDLVTGLGSPVANLVVGGLVGYGATAATLPTDPNFKSPGVGTGTSAYRYNPSGLAWTFAGSAGLAGNGSIFTAGNPVAPQGTQVAFVQQQGSVSQTVNLPANTYVLTFSAAQRANWQATFQTLAVEIDGNVVAAVTPSGGGYATYGTASFAVAAGNHTITFLGTNPNGGDNTAFFDQVALYAAAPQLSDPGFLEPAVGTGDSAYRYDPVGAAWTFSGTAGVAGNNSAFTAGNPVAWQGAQVAFVQQTGAVSQTAYFPAGAYTIGFSAAQRGNVPGNSQTIQVRVDGNLVGTFTPSGSAYANFTTAAFGVAAGRHTIVFAGTNPNGGDNTAFLDEVAVAAAVNQFADPGFASPNVGTGNAAYQYDPASSSWTFGGTAGVAGNGSVFTGGNPAAPQGTQVAFLQQFGQVSQVVNFSAGTWTINLSAAQRANTQAGGQSFNVLVDGAVVATITPGGTGYATYTTASFTVTAGNHTVTFVGTDPNGGDNTAFLDQLAINPS